MEYGITGSSLGELPVGTTRIGLSHRLGRFGHAAVLAVVPALAAVGVDHGRQVADHIAAAGGARVAVKRFVRWAGATEARQHRDHRADHHRQQNANQQDPRGHRTASVCESGAFHHAALRLVQSKNIITHL